MFCLGDRSSGVVDYTFGVRFGAKIMQITTVLTRILKNFWVLGVIAVVALLPQLVFAADSPVVNSGVGFHPVPGDLSIVFLRKIFGAVSGADTLSGDFSGSGTIFGEIFYVFNCGLLMLVGITLFYTICRSIIEIAHANVGQMAGRFSWWQPIRVILGVGLLVPQSTGYSVLNSLVMWVVIQGVGLADNVWVRAVDYVAKGGVLYATSTAAVNKEGGAAEAEVNISLIKNDSGYATSSDVFRSHVCMRYLYKAVEQYRQYIAKDIKENPHNYPQNNLVYYRQITSPTPIFHEGYVSPYLAGGKPELQFPANAKEVISSTAPGAETTNLNGVCGTYVWQDVPAAPQGGDVSGPERYKAAKEVGLRMMTSALAAAADEAVNRTEGTTKEFPDSVAESAYASLVNAAASYQYAVTPASDYAAKRYGLISASVKESDKDRFGVADLTKDGWISAGYFYFTLTNVVRGEKTGVDQYFFVTKRNVPVCGSGGTCSDDLGIQNIDKYSAQNTGISKEYGKYVRDRLRYAIARVTDTSEPYLYDEAVSLAKDLNTRFAANTDSLPTDLKNFLQNRRVDLILTSMPVGPFVGIPSALVHVASGVIPGIDEATRSIISMITDEGGAASAIVFAPLNASLNNIFGAWFHMFFESKCAGYMCGFQGVLPIAKIRDLGLIMILETFQYWHMLFDLLSTSYFAALNASSIVSLAGFAVSLIPFAAIGIGAQIAIDLLHAIYHFILDVPLMIMVPMGMAVSTLMIVNGVVLAYYIPLLPFMLFLFGVMSWLMFVVEGMVAAPLVALGVTHPEGHDLMGKADQALMLLLSMFVRPVAMVIGLIASMVLSAVAIDILNVSFGKIIQTLYYSEEMKSTFAPAPSLGLYNYNVSVLAATRNIAMILIYMFIVMALIKQCCSIIYSLPNQIMLWIGAPHRGEGMDAQQLAEGVKMGLEHATDKISGHNLSPLLQSPSLPVHTMPQGGGGKKEDGGDNKDKTKNNKVLTGPGG